MKSKFNKESRKLLIGLLLGDGTICKNNVFKLSQCIQQKDYLEWKIKQLNNNGIRNTGVKSYISTRGFNEGKEVVYTELNIIPFIKLLRRVVYRNGKKTFSRKLLNRLDAKGLAIWFMDDGHINIRRDKNKRPMGFYIKISTCEPKEEVQIMIDYFKEAWNVNFYMFHEGRKEDSYSLCCGTKEGLKFIEIIRPYIEQIPSMLYKITYDLSQRRK